MKRINLIAEFDKYYKGSDLQKIVKNMPLPIKYTINGYDCFFYNADLFGLFDWNITKDGFKTNDFINNYKDGFVKGLKHLNKIEKIKIKDIKNTNTKTNTILQIQYILFEREFKSGNKGLIDLVFNKLPLIFTEKIIHDYGFWNGIIHSIENLSNITGLNKNDLEILPPQQTETNILIKLEKEIETISKQMSIFKSSESKEINVCVISKTEIFDVNLLDNYLLNQTKNQYLDARLTDLKNLCEKVKKSNENKIDASNKETLFKYEFKRTNKKTNDPECYKFSSFNESIFLLNTAELKYKKIDFNEAEKHYKNGYFAKSFSKGLLALKCNEILEVLNKYLTDKTSTNKHQTKDKTKELWFNIGLSFAKGEAQKQWQNKNISFEAIATNLGFKKTDKTYFSNTLQNTNNQKNIYNDINKMNLLFNYCEKEKINMCNDFINKYNELQAKNV